LWRTLKEKANNDWGQCRSSSAAFVGLKTLFSQCLLRSAYRVTSNQGCAREAFKKKKRLSYGSADVKQPDNEFLATKSGYGY
jgi:hypothetical protein